MLNIDKCNSGFKCLHLSIKSVTSVYHIYSEILSESIVEIKGLKSCYLL